MTVAVYTALFTGLALLILAIVAVTTGSSGSEKSRVKAKGGPISAFVGAAAYLILFAPKFTEGGVSFTALLLLVVAVIIPPLVAGAAAGVRANLGDSARSVFDLASVIVAFTVLTGILATAGELLSLMGGVNRTIAIAAVGLCGAGYLLARGREASSRTSRWTLGFAVVIPVLLFVGGLALGSFATVTASLVPSTSMPLDNMLAVLLVAAACGFVDPALGLVMRGVDKPIKVSVWGAVIAGLFTLFFGLGLILFYGGAFVAPSLQAFLLAAAPPVLIGFFLFFAVFVIASISDSQLAAGSEVASEITTPDKRRPITAVLALVAVVLAILVPAPLQILVIGATVAAAAIGAVLPAMKGDVPGLNALPGVLVGIVGAVVVDLIMGVGKALDLTGATAVSLIVALVLSAVTSLIVGRKAATPAMAS